MTYTHKMHYSLPLLKTTNLFLASFWFPFQELALLFEELDDDRDGQVSFDEFLHGLFVAKDIQQSDIEPEWEQKQHSTPYNQAPAEDFTTKVRNSSVHRNFLEWRLRIAFFCCFFLCEWRIAIVLFFMWMENSNKLARLTEVNFFPCRARGDPWTMMIHFFSPGLEEVVQHLVRLFSLIAVFLACNQVCRRDWFVSTVYMYSVFRDFSSSYSQ